MSLDVRAQLARDWALAALRQLPGAPPINAAGPSFLPASADASFRRYFRIAAHGRSWIVMDAPPPLEDCRPFVRIAGLFAEAGLHVPVVLAQDLERGLLLLDDLGSQTYLEFLNASGADPDGLYHDAIDALIRLQLASRPGVLPPYNEALLRRELALFPDWYLARALGRSLSPSEAVWWDTVQQRLVASALAQPRVWVHRDYMPRNLMPARPNPGVLDFQDAVEGPISYDLVCLTRDAFLSWPVERVDGWVALYLQRARAAGLPVGDDDAAFVRALDLMGAQRHLKVLGIFARICHRDGKPRYLADAPRFLRYLHQACARQGQLEPLQRLLESLGLAE